MTMKHLLEGAMQHSKTRNHHQFATLTELDPAVVNRIAKGKCVGLHIKTMDQIQRTTGVPFNQLFAWYRMPEGEHLGRVEVAA